MEVKAVKDEEGIVIEEQLLGTSRKQVLGKRIRRRVGLLSEVLLLVAFQEYNCQI